MLTAGFCETITLDDFFEAPQEDRTANAMLADKNKKDLFISKNNF